MLRGPCAVTSRGWWLQRRTSCGVGLADAVCATVVLQHCLEWGSLSSWLCARQDEPCKDRGRKRHVRIGRLCAPHASAAVPSTRLEDSEASSRSERQDVKPHSRLRTLHFRPRAVTPLQVGASAGCGNEGGRETIGAIKQSATRRAIAN